MKKTKSGFLTAAAVLSALALTLAGCPQNPEEGGDRKDKLPVPPAFNDTAKDYYNVNASIPAKTTEPQIAAFKMSTLLSYEIWWPVRDWAEKPGADYTFANPGVMAQHVSDPASGTFSGKPDTKSAADGGMYDNKVPGTNDTISGLCNKPVCDVSLRDAIIWCNALSESEGLDPVYRDSSGNILLDATKAVETLIDPEQMKGKNGYRLPYAEEWEYALLAGGADITQAGIPGIDGKLGMYATSRTTTVSKAGYTNTWGLPDMLGNAWEWVLTEGTGDNAGKYLLMGGDFNEPESSFTSTAPRKYVAPTEIGGRGQAQSFRVMLNNK